MSWSQLSVESARWLFRGLSKRFWCWWRHFVWDMVFVEGGKAWKLNHKLQVGLGRPPRFVFTLTQFFQIEMLFRQLTWNVGGCKELKLSFPKSLLPKMLHPARRRRPDSAAELSPNPHLKEFQELFCSGGTSHLNPAMVVDLVHPPPSPIRKFHWKGHWKQGVSLEMWNYPVKWWHWKCQKELMVIGYIQISQSTWKWSRIWIPLLRVPMGLGFSQDFTRTLRKTEFALSATNWFKPPRPSPAWALLFGKEEGGTDPSVFYDFTDCYTANP